ncbi:hypothetical protein BD413DRAFT_270234 [Trametes elegans]|nr:hypothetical protein BD413DRAFT_270234 [Trametes elegans]
MAAQQSADGIESAPSPAVSSLRSRFEKLAADSSVPPPASSLKPPGTFQHPGHVPSSPRLLPHGPADGDHVHPEPHSPLLHPVSFSSDLRTGAKRPPPPPPFRPPSRAPSPANPRVSPLVHPVRDTTPVPSDNETASESSSIAVKTRAASVSRRPPPPPPAAHEHSSPPRPAGVSSLIKQFG